MEHPDELRLAGKNAFLRQKDGRGYRVLILGSRIKVYGRDKVLVRPLDGLTPDVWVNLARVKITPAGKEQSA